MDILTLAKELGTAIQNDDSFVNFKIREQAVQCDETLQNMIEEFNLKKVSINHEISKEETNQEKIDNLNDEISKLYSDILENENMKLYNEAKQEFENTLKKVNLIINGSAMGQDPNTIDTELTNECSGSCSSCSGCH